MSPSLISATVTVVCLHLLLLLLTSPLILSQTVIFTSQQDGFSSALPSAVVSAVVDPHMSGRSFSGYYIFNVSWNGDLLDQYIITPPLGATLTTVNSSAGVSGIPQCTPSLLTTPPLAITLTATSVHQCTYNLSFGDSSNGGALRVSYKAYQSVGTGTGVTARVTNIYQYTQLVRVPLGCSGRCPTYVIFVDRNSSFSVNDTLLLEASAKSTISFRTTYSTLQPGSISFTVLSDTTNPQYLLSAPPQLTVQAVAGSSAACTPSASTTPAFIVTFNSTFTQCTYTASWSTPLDDFLLVSYISNDDGLQTNDIYVAFTSNCTSGVVGCNATAQSSTGALPAPLVSSSSSASTSASASASLSPPVLATSSPRSPSPSPSSSIPGPSAGVSGSLCVLLYSLPGTLDYPFSIAYSLQLVYSTAAVTGSAGQAVALLSGTGSRVYTNRFGVVFSTPVTLVTSGQASAPLLHLNSSSVLDGTGLTFSLSSPVQQPGGNPQRPVSQLSLFSVGGVVQEGGSAVFDAQGQAVVSSVPGVLNATIGAADVNGLSPFYPTCQAPITFTNGLRSSVEPAIVNSPIALRFIYTISDSSTYSVTANLSIHTVSQFSNLRDQLGNEYQTVATVTGVRVYTNLLTGATVSSTVQTVAANVSNTTMPGHGDQRFYPYSYLTSAPGVYSFSTTPFFDASGLVFAVSPAVPANGQVGGALYSTVALFVNASSTGTAVLTELPLGTNPPLLSLQKQSYVITQY